MTAQRRIRRVFADSHKGATRMTPIRLVILWTACMLANHTGADHDLIIPLNVQMITPDETVPPSCRRFFNPAGWGEGAWDDARPHALLVTRIDSDCTATVIYGYGGWNHDGTGDWISLSAAIRGDRLIVPLPLMDAFAEYEITVNGQFLHGRFHSRDRARTSEVLLQRL